AGVDFASAVKLGYVGRADHAAGGRDHIVEDDRDFLIHRAADQVGLLRFGGARTALVHDGNGAADLFLVHAGALDAALVRTQYDQVADGNVQAAHILIDDRAGVQVIDRD